MDISIKSVDDVSAISGQAFAPGDSVWCYLYRTPDGLIERMDILDSERDQLELAGPVICKWVHRIKEKEASEADERRAALQSADEVFLSLFETEAEGTEDPLLDEARARLKFFLALQLERKRILKPIGKRRFRHVPTKREFTVPDMEITPDLIAQFQQELALMGTPR